MWSGIVQRAAYELISAVAYQSPSSPAGGDDDKHPEKVFLVFFFPPSVSNQFCFRTPREK